MDSNQSRRKREYTKLFSQSPSTSSIKLSNEQNVILNEIYDLYDNKKFDKYLVIKGEPGVGKSALINAITRPKITLAYTNEAARNVNGYTLHSYFKIAIKDFTAGLKTSEEILNYVKEHIIINGEVDENVIFVIDEASMCPLFIIFALWIKCKNKSLLIFFGDPKQAKPISDDQLNVYDMDNIGIHRTLGTNFRFEGNYLEFVRKLLDFQDDIDQLKEFIKMSFDDNIFTSDFLDEDIKDEDGTFICYTNKSILKTAERKYGNCKKIAVRVPSGDIEPDILEMITDCCGNKFLPYIYISPDIVYTKTRGVEMGLPLKIIDYDGESLVCDKNNVRFRLNRQKFILQTDKYPLLKMKRIYSVYQFQIKFLNIITVHRVQGKTLKCNGYLHLQNCKDFNVIYTAFSRFPSFHNIKRIVL